jgi:hypothetical protein
MNAVCLNVFHDKLVVVGTDGREMFKDVIETGVGGGWLEYATFGAGSSAALLITKRARKVLATAVTEGELTVTADTRLCEFRADGCRVVLSQIDGRYPNYESVIPKGEYSVTASRDALRDAGFLLEPSPFIEYETEAGKSASGTGTGYTHMVIVARTDGDM